MRLKTTEIKNQEDPTPGTPCVRSVPACNNAEMTAVRLEVSVFGACASALPQEPGVHNGSYSNPVSRDVDPTPVVASEELSGFSPGISGPVDAQQLQGEDASSLQASLPGSDPKAMDKNSDQSLKRRFDSQESDFIPPNRPVKPREMGEKVLKTSNKFAPIMSISDIMSSSTQK